MEKKTKLTISGSAKKSIKNIEIAKTQGKNSVVIEKQSNKFPSRGGASRPGSYKGKTTSTLNRGFTAEPLLNVKLDLGLFDVDLNEPPLPENFPVCFSITTEFFP